MFAICNEEAVWAGTFGPGSWALPAVEVEHPAGQERVRLFARFLLEGKVAPQLNKFTSRYKNINNNPNPAVKFIYKSRQNVCSILQIVCAYYFTQILSLFLQSPVLPCHHGEVLGQFAAQVSCVG